ncbi:MAG: prolyl oligopeptidase family serine peptidase [Myxococcota bacterium]|nr:prolyl oligopeptidase family serine peptidase [Myxococcota bacterium]
MGVASFFSMAGPYPTTPRIEVVDMLHGTAVVDPYRWLENGRDRRVEAWFHAEGAFADAALRTLPGRVEIAARLRNLQATEVRQGLIHAGDAPFYLLKDGAHDRARLVRQADGTKTVAVVLDPNGWGEDNLGDFTPSIDGSRIAYEVKRQNADAATLRIVHVGSGEVSETDVLDGIEGTIPQWTAAGDAFYYVYTPRDAPHAERFGYQSVRRHRLGTGQASDEIVFPPTGDGTKTLDCALDVTGGWFIVTVSHGWTDTDVYFRRDGGGDWRRLETAPGAHYRVLPLGGAFFIQTDDGAPNGRILRADPVDPARDRWREVVPSRSSAALKRASVVGDKLLLTYSTDALTSFEIHDLNGGQRAIVPPGIGASFMTGRPGDDTAFLYFSSMSSPPSIWRVSVRSGEQSLFFRRDVPFDGGRFVVERVFAMSKDGTKIPVFVARARDVPLDGSAPALLYGYGGFRVSLQPAFREDVVPWLERGGIYALACVRGGLEYGEAWHRGGMLHNKQNVFDDFIAAAKWLVSHRFARSDRLAIEGSSNGGLLVAAAATQRPDLFRAALCGEPLTDMLRYPLFGRGGVPEFGDPDKEDDFRALLGYSPYHRIRDGVRYPAFLVTASAADERADAMHARKLVARLQEASRGGPVLLRVEWSAGHAGAAGQDAAIEKRSDELAFILAATAAP